MKQIVYITTTAVLAFACTHTAKLADEANLHYNNLEYHTAANQYHQYLKDHEDHLAEIRLAECYYHMNHLSDAGKIYAKAIRYPEIRPTNQLQFAHILKHNGDLTSARKWFVEYLIGNPKDLAVKNELRSCDSIENYQRHAYEYLVNQAPFNGEVSDFSPALYKDGIVFCSERTKPGDPTAVSQWTGHTYLDLYFTQISTETEPLASAKSSGPFIETSSKTHLNFADPVPFAAELNSMFNEGPLCFTKDGKTVYFTRNIVSSQKEEKQSVNNFEIYRSDLHNNVWSKPELLSFDNKNYSVGHPALSKDEKRLYFASNMPGGLGGTDIYYCEWVDGKWSVPVNAGATINTSENEMFPSIFVDAHGRETLYFSSEGHPGMGGLDLYACEVQDHGKFSQPRHLNAPLNSASDDFGIIFAPDGRSGYFSSNRNQDDGSDKIYSFKKYIPEFFLVVTVLKKGTSEPLPGAAVDIDDQAHAKKDNSLADASGKVTRQIDQNSKLFVNARKDNFFAAEGSIDNLGKVLSDTLRLTLELDPIVINKPIRLDNIYYDFDKWNIRKDATPALDKLVKIMTDNPGIHIELSSHTDSRGKDKYNMTLSQKRAESAVKYIISQGIAAERIYAKGYGESLLLNNCKNSVKCGETDHQLNRRTEFKVTKIEPAPIKP